MPEECEPAGRSGHDCARHAWLVKELGDWFTDDRQDARDSRLRVQQALWQGAIDAQSFLGSEISDGEVVQVELLLRGLHGGRCSVYREVPTPVALLMVCLEQAFPGDEVTLTQLVARRGRVAAQHRWPFGLDVAEQLTRPGDLLFADNQDHDGSADLDEPADVDEPGGPTGTGG
jgi:hypothetical protein